MRNTEILINNGVNIEKSLSILGDMNLFNDTIDTFVKESDEKLSKLVSYKEQNDMINFAILVRSLKSESIYLGFEKLAFLSFQHESAIESNNTGFVITNFNELINEFNRVVFVCKQYVGIQSNNELKGKILVVDDSSIIRNFVKKIFKDEYEVLTSENGNQAIETVKNDKDILCMLLDLNMPECNGFEVLEYLKVNNLFRQVPVALLTGDDTKDSIDKAFQYPIVDLVSKPFNESDVRAIVDKMISIHNFN
ncbi:MAG: response regulator [Firmicutes bacterium]|nr:response regulator [Bacillota bacterium]